MPKRKKSKGFVANPLSMNSLPISVLQPRTFLPMNSRPIMSPTIMERALSGVNLINSPTNLVARTQMLRCCGCTSCACSCHAHRATKVDAGSQTCEEDLTRQEADRPNPCQLPIDLSIKIPQADRNSQLQLGVQPIVAKPPKHSNGIAVHRKGTFKFHNMISVMQEANKHHFREDDDDDDDDDDADDDDDDQADIKPIFFAKLNEDRTLKHECRSSDEGSPSKMSKWAVFLLKSNCRRFCIITCGVPWQSGLAH